MGNKEVKVIALVVFLVLAVPLIAAQSNIDWGGGTTVGFQVDFETTPTTCGERSKSQCGDAITDEDDEIKSTIYTEVGGNLGMEDATGDDLNNFCDTRDEDIYVKELENGMCEDLVGCGCEWNEGEGVCQEKVIATEEYICGGGGGGSGNGAFECKTTTNLENQCGTAENNYLLSWTGKLFLKDTNTEASKTVDWCGDGSKSYPCPSTSKLPFFGWFNFVIAGFMIAGIYYLLSRKE